MKIEESADYREIKSGDIECGKCKHKGCCSIQINNTIFCKIHKARVPSFGYTCNEIKL